jgi:hypothetical protein
MRNRLSRIFVALAGAVLLAACTVGPPGHEETTLSWQEEVQLQDGRVITIERTEYFSAYCGPGVMCRSTRGHRTRSKIEFGYEGRPAAWEQAMAPLLLDIIRSQPVVIATFTSRDQESQYQLEHGQPEAAYVVFRYQHGAWTKGRFEDADVPRNANLLVNSEGFGSWTSLARKREFNSQRGVDKSLLWIQ